LRGVLLAASLFAAAPLAPGCCLPSRRVRPVLAQQPLPERVARASAQVAPPEHQLARLWQQDAWPPAPDSERPQQSRQQRDADVESAFAQSPSAPSNLWWRARWRAAGWTAAHWAAAA